MAIDNTVTITGNITQDPQLARSAGGTAYLRFSIAWNQMRGDEQVPNFFDVTAFNTLAENAAASLTVGKRVTVTGRLEQSSYTAEDGSKRSSVRILADSVAADLKWATAEVSKNAAKVQTQPAPEVAAVEESEEF